MSYDYASDGYIDPIFVWEGSWNKRSVRLHMWRKIDPHQHGVWKYALDIRNRHNETISLRTDELNHLMAEVLYRVISGEKVTDKKVPSPTDRFTLLFGESK